jgi:hypothetical protein
VTGTTFRLAPMSPLIRSITIAVLALPPVLFVAAALGGWPFAVPGLLLLAMDGWVWLRFRPSRFVVGPDALEVRWPLKARRIPRADIAAVRVIDADTLRRETGGGVRVGAGGLWGGFGWLWTGRRGLVQMYVSRTDGLVWIERAGGRPWLITPHDPEGFVRALSR